MRQSVHQHIGRSDARELPPEGLGHHAGGLPEIPGFRGLQPARVFLQRPEDNTFPLHEDRMQLHVQE